MKHARRRFKILIFLLTLAKCAQGQLYCYVCDDCENTNGEILQYCGPKETSTVLPEETTTTTYSTPDTTTVPPEVTTSTVPSEATTTTVPRETTTTTTVPPETTTKHPSEVTTTGPTEATITVPPEATTTGPPEATTTLSSEVTTTISEGQTTTSSGEGRTSTLSKEDGTTSNRPEETTTTTTQTAESSLNTLLEEIPTFGDFSISRRRRDTSGTVYACYSIALKGGETAKRQVNRGCLAMPLGQNGCEFLKKENNLNASLVENCLVCQNDGCNGSAIAKLSGLALLAALVLRLLQ